MVRWSEHAQSQLRKIYEYIAQDSPIYAKRIVENLLQKTIVLDRLPKLGRMVPEVNDDSIRELSLYSYRILYEIHSTHVEVLAVVHKRQNFQNEEILTL